MRVHEVCFWSCAVPLKSVSVDVRIEGYIANVRATLCYKNVEKNPIEARYEFPMDDQSTVYHFEAQIEDRIIIAECQEKEQVRMPVYNFCTILIHV